MLTPRQREIWDYLLAYVDQHGYPPTVREIGQKLGISHVAVVKLRKKIREKCAGLKKDLKEGYQN